MLSSVPGRGGNITAFLFGLGGTCLVSVLAVSSPPVSSSSSSSYMSVAGCGSSSGSWRSHEPYFLRFRTHRVLSGAYRFAQAMVHVTISSAATSSGSFPFLNNLYRFCAVVVHALSWHSFVGL